MTSNTRSIPRINLLRYRATPPFLEIAALKKLWFALQPVDKECRMRLLRWAVSRSTDEVEKSALLEKAS